MGFFVLGVAGKERHTHKKKTNLGPVYLQGDAQSVKISTRYFDYFCNKSESKDSHYSYTPGLYKPLSTTDGRLACRHTYSPVKKYLELHPHRIRQCMT
jgi:hypothetical protein